MAFDASPLSSENVLRDVHDPVQQRLRVDSSISAVIENVEMAVEIDAADGDNIAIHDSDAHELDINSDGSINIVPIKGNPGDLKTVFNEVTSVASSILTTIQTYTAPIGKTTYLQKVSVSGNNIAEYRIEINSVVQDKKRTYFGGDLNLEFGFVDSGTGLPLAVGDSVTIKVIHERPNVGDFNSRIQTVEV